MSPTSMWYVEPEVKSVSRISGMSRYLVTCVKVGSGYGHTSLYLQEETIITIISQIRNIMWLTEGLQEDLHITWTITWALFWGTVPVLLLNIYILCYLHYILEGNFAPLLFHQNVGLQIWSTEKTHLIRSVYSRIETSKHYLVTIICIILYLDKKKKQL